MDEKRPVFSVRMFGHLSFCYDDKTFMIKCNMASKVMQLFRLLLLAGEEGVPKGQLLTALYGNDETQDTKNAFRILIFRLRKLLGETVIPAGDRIWVEKGIYRFGGPFTTIVDAVEFDQMADRALITQNEEERMVRLKEACRRFTGGFLPFLVDEEWVMEENVRYKDLYFDLVQECCRLMQKNRRYEDMLELCSDAVKIYPFEEWQLLKIDCLLAMNRYKEALKVYEDATTMFFEGAGTSPSEKMLSRFRAMSSQIQYAMGDLGDIKNSLKEKDIDKGAYYCSYPSFIDSYRIITRMVERSGRSIFLMLCTLTDSKGEPLDKEEFLAEQSANLSDAICKSLRRGDIYTRYSLNQFLILLIGIKQEDCEITFDRIMDVFREDNPTQKVKVRHYVSTIVEIKIEKTDRSFGFSKDLWKKDR